jgi:hypothetical protein
MIADMINSSCPDAPFTLAFNITFLHKVSYKSVQRTLEVENRYEY